MQRSCSEEEQDAATKADIEASAAQAEANRLADKARDEDIAQQARSIIADTRGNHKIQRQKRHVKYLKSTASNEVAVSNNALEEEEKSDGMESVQDQEMEVEQQTTQDSQKE